VLEPGDGNVGLFDAGARVTEQLSQGSAPARADSAAATSARAALRVGLAAMVSSGPWSTR
jgi:hypothetical protein